MKILRIIGSADPRTGGPIEGVLRSSAAMRALGHSNEIVCLDRPTDPWVNAHPLPVHAMGHWSRRYSYSPRLTPWLRAHLGDYDAAIIHGLWNYSSVGAGRALVDSDIPYFVFPHGMMDPWFGRSQPIKGFAKQLYWSLFESRVLAGADSVLFTSEEERRLARTAFRRGAYRERVVAYGAAEPPPPQSAQLAAFQALTPRLGDRPFLLFLSRIHPKKGCDLLIEAFAEIAAAAPALDLVIAGPDQTGWRSALEQRAAALGIDGRIHWPGMLSGDAKWGAYRGAEAFVLPSHQENFGIVVAEAMACALPVLITDKVNIWSEIEAHEAGLVRGDDAAGVQDLLSTFLALDAQARRRMGEAARRCFVERFEIGRSARDILHVIEGAIA